ncbi:MAG TPA: DoxX family protein [Candidatus Paceibacterota bacterium]
MLNTFPELLFLKSMAPTLIRLGAGAYFIMLGYSKFTLNRHALITYFDSIKIKPADKFVKALGFTEFIIGACMIIGLLTQIASIIGAIIAFVSLVVVVRDPQLKMRSWMEYMLLFLISLSLVFSGAGLWALDLPL